MPILYYLIVMFANGVKRVSSLMMMQRRFMARLPAIKFTHGDRTVIVKEMQADHTPAWFVKHGAAPSTASTTSSRPTATGPVTGSTVTLSGGKKTTTIYMDSEFFGDPFQRPTMSFDETTIAMIELGGAMPDVPKPEAKDKKKK